MNHHSATRAATTTTGTATIQIPRGRLTFHRITRPLLTDALPVALRIPLTVRGNDFVSEHDDVDEQAEDAQCNQHTFDVRPALQRAESTRSGAARG